MAASCLRRRRAPCARDSVCASKRRAAAATERPRAVNEGNGAIAMSSRAGSQEREGRESTERIGFLGLGIMGSRMAANVARAGFPLSVWTHTPGKAESWASQHGATAPATPAEVAERSDIVVSMVVDGEQVASVLLGEDGVI